MLNLEYLHDIPLPEAWKRFGEALQKIGKWSRLGFEEIALNEKAIDRILAEPVLAKISSPQYHASAMDGFAVRSIDTEGADSTAPVILSITTQAQYVDTGGALLVGRKQ
jgi:putative molybdopterin biosynthesis protein